METGIKTVIFDFGNVVAHFDYGPAFARLSDFTELSAAEMRAVLNASGLPDQYELGQITSEVFLDRTLQLCRLNSNCDRPTLIEAWSNIFALNHEIADLIARLKPTHRLLLGSNTNELHALHFRRQFAATLAHFDELVLSYQVGTMKPDARFFQRCLELARCQPNECVFIDDLGANIDSARKLGMHGIVYRSGQDVRQNLARLGVTI